MKHIALILFAILSLSHQSFAQKVKLPQPYIAEGRGAYDGDSPTIKVTVNGVDTTYRIRLWGIDAPEHNSIYVDSTQPYSMESAKFMRVLVKDQKLFVQPMYTDDFGRSVCRLTVQDSISVNELAIKTGNAWYRAEPKMTRVESKLLKQYQSGAEKLESGLWKPGRYKPVKPSTWRQRYSGWHRKFIDLF